MKPLLNTYKDPSKRSFFSVKLKRLDRAMAIPKLHVGTSPRSWRPSLSFCYKNGTFSDIWVAPQKSQDQSWSSLKSINPKSSWTKTRISPTFLDVFFFKLWNLSVGHDWILTTAKRRKLLDLIRFWGKCQHPTFLRESWPTRIMRWPGDSLESNALMKLRWATRLCRPNYLQVSSASGVETLISSCIVWPHTSTQNLCLNIRVHDQECTLDLYCDADLAGCPRRNRPVVSF